VPLMPVFDIVRGPKQRGKALLTWRTHVVLSSDSGGQRQPGRNVQDARSVGLNLVPRIQPHSPLGIGVHVETGLQVDTLPAMLVVPTPGRRAEPTVLVPAELTYPIPHSTSPRPTLRVHIRRPANYAQNTSQVIAPILATGF